jgi:hypothetical protein
MAFIPLLRKGVRTTRIMAVMETEISGRWLRIRSERECIHGIAQR